jgi:DNA modification methylase
VNGIRKIIVSKSPKTCRFLIGKHSHRGELVLDLCSCTASMTLAAIETNRGWVYIESNSANYRLGGSRIQHRSLACIIPKYHEPLLIADSDVHISSLRGHGHNDCFFSNPNF